MSISDIVTFNESLESLLTSILELTNIDESSHEDPVVIILTCNFFKQMKKTV